MNADDACNYGAIGVVIGHEMTHGFDDQGRQYDKDGNLKDWWTSEDAKNFKERAQVLVDYFNKIEVLPGLMANGELTLGENIADHGGLQVAYLALQKAMTENPLGKDESMVLLRSNVSSFHTQTCGQVISVTSKSVCKQNRSSLFGTVACECSASSY